MNWQSQSSLSNQSAKLDLGFPWERICLLFSVQMNVFRCVSRVTAHFTESNGEHRAPPALPGSLQLASWLRPELCQQLGDKRERCLKQCQHLPWITTPALKLCFPLTEICGDNSVSCLIKYETVRLPVAWHSSFYILEHPWEACFLSVRRERGATRKEGCEGRPDPCQAASQGSWGPGNGLTQLYLLLWGQRFQVW